MAKATKWEKLKRKVALVGLFYAFIVAPLGIIAFALCGGLDTELAQSILDFLGGLASGPAGEFIWEIPGDTSGMDYIPPSPRY